MIRAFETGVSEADILFWPGGSVNVDCLDDMLRTAHERGMKASANMRYLTHQREESFDVTNPTYFTSDEVMSVRQMRALYKQLTGTRFDPTIEKPKMGDAVFTLVHNERTGELFVIDMVS